MANTSRSICVPAHFCCENFICYPDNFRTGPHLTLQSNFNFSLISTKFFNVNCLILKASTKRVFFRRNLFNCKSITVRNEPGIDHFPLFVNPSFSMPEQKLGLASTLLQGIPRKNDLPQDGRPSCK